MSGNSTDIMQLAFINPTSGQTSGDIEISATSFNNYTEVAFENDFFVPPSGLTFTIADNDLSAITNFLQVGYQVQVSINNSPQGNFYIFDYDVSYSKGSGTLLSVKCKDFLEYLAQGSVYPNLGTNSTTNYHFPPTQTLQNALAMIATSFLTPSGTTAVEIQTDNSGNLTFATGFAVGLDSNGSRNLQTALNHITMPSKGETYLAYMLRLAKMAGCELKMAASPANTIICKPPTYNRDGNPSPYALIHNLSSPNNQNNNVISAHYHFGLDKQPSVIIVEANTTSNGGNFYQSTLKGIAINELVAYPPGAANTNGIGQQIKNSIPNVGNAIGQLTNGQLGSGFVAVPFNQNLYNQQYTFPVSVNTNISLPSYVVSGNAHSQTEVLYAAGQMLAECQDKFLEIEYVVEGWTMQNTSAIWQPDMMVSVTEEVFSPGNPTTFQMWIRRVKFLKTRHGGTTTQLTLTLPYTHQFNSAAAISLVGT